MDGASLKSALVARAKALGFDAVRVAKAELRAETGASLDNFLELGRHGDMDWLAREPDRRRHPQGLWAEARSAIVLGLNYGLDSDPMTRLADRQRGVVSVYAQGRDYHDIVKGRLKTLGQWLHRESGAPFKVFVDTAPVMEKPLAAAAGIGWQGKHTNLVSREFGSWLFLGEILTTLELPPDEPEGDHCGSCRNCLDICPTAAFPAPYTLDARRCISYLTIEHKGPIPREFREPMGNRIYGCDDCLAVCPWNKFAAQTAEMAFAPREILRSPLLIELARLDDAGFRTAFSASPIKRIGRDRFVRNVMIALGNSGDRDAVETIVRLLDDASPLVRGMAVWALSRLDPARLESLAAQCANETDPYVIAEWNAAFMAAPLNKSGRRA